MHPMYRNKYLINWILESEKLNKYNEIEKHKLFFKECQNHKILLKKLLVTLKKQKKKDNWIWCFYKRKSYTSIL